MTRTRVAKDGELPKFLPALGVFVALVAAGIVPLPAYAVCSTVITTVTCSGSSDPLASGANDLSVTVTDGGVGVPLDLGGPGNNAMTLLGNNVTLLNNGAIDPEYGALQHALTSGTVIGNTNASNVSVTNNGTMAGVSNQSVSQAGMALTVRNGSGGTTSITNAGTLFTKDVSDPSIISPDAGVIVTYGGAQTNIDNSGPITGRIALGSAQFGGNTFTNSGTIHGSVSLGALSSGANQFIATTDSLVDSGGHNGAAVDVPIGDSTNGFETLGFAATGLVDGGSSANSTLTLRQGLSPTGSIINANYVNFGFLVVQSGIWTLNGASTVSSASLFNGATAVISNPSALGVGSIMSVDGTIQAAASLSLPNDIFLGTNGLKLQSAAPWNIALGGVVAGSGSLTQANSGWSLGLNGANTYTGGTFLNGGNVVLGNAAGFGTGSVTVDGFTWLDNTQSVNLANRFILNPGSTLVIGGSNALGFNDLISGDGILLKTGAGTMSFNGADLHTGGTAITQGRFVVGADGSMSPTGAVGLAGGTEFDVSLAAPQTVGVLAGDPGSAVTLGAKVLTFGDSTDQTFGGHIDGTGGIVKQGTGTETLTGSNTYTGGTTISNGTLALSASGSLASDGAVNLAGPGAAFDISAPGANPTIGTLSGIADTTVALGANTLTFGDTTNQTFRGVIAGPGAIVKQGSGTQTLTGANTLSGNVEIKEGTLALGAGGLLSTGKVYLSGAGAVFDISASGANQTIGSLTGVADTTVSLGANTLTFGSSAGFDGFISGSGGLTLTSGLQAFTRANTYTGDTTVNNAALYLGNDGRAGQDSRLVLNNGTLDISLLSPNSTVGIRSLAGTGSVSLGNIGATLMLDNANDSFSGAISGDGKLDITGGRQVLNGNNTYTGATTVRAGSTLIVGDASATGAAIAGTVNVNGGTLGGGGAVRGDTIISAGGTLAPGDLSSLGTLTFGGNLTIGSGTQIDFDFGTPGSNFQTPGQSDSVVVTGNLDIDASTLNVADAGMGPGLYKLFSWGGTLNTSNGGLVAPVGTALQVLLADKQINLVYAGGQTLNLWNANGAAGPNAMGGGDGTWDLVSSMWSDTNGTLTGPMVPGPGFAVFGGASGLVTVDNSRGVVSATGMQFMTDGYRMMGDTLTLTGSNGAAPIIHVDAGATATIDNMIASTNGINKTNGGTLVLNAANAYSGNTVLSGGTLSVSSDANLGMSANAIDFEGGTLQVSGVTYQQTARNIIWGTPGGGFDIADAGNTFTVAQSLSGSGGLLKTGAGKLVLTGNNAYTGGTRVSGGTLQGDTGSLQGNIVNNAQVVFVQASDGTFNGNVSGSGSLVKDGTGVLAMIGSSSYTGGTSVIAGTLQGDSNSLQGDIANNAAVVFKQASDGVYAGAMTGNGVLNKDGAGVLILTGNSSAYAGSTQLRAGGLQVDGNLSGTLSVQSGTVLSGIGSVGSTTIASGGTLAPGNAAAPKGTLTVNGDLTFASSSTYRVSTDAAGASSSVHATGSASLAGTVLSVAENGTYGLSTRYGILSADGGVSGTFNTVSSNLAFLAPSLEYSADKVDLVMDLKQITPPAGDGALPGDGGTSPGDGGTPPTRPIRFADLAFTGNQRAVANALQSLPSSSKLYTRVLNLPAGAPAAVFNSLTGEAHASTVTSMQGVGERVGSLPLSHLLDNLNAGQLPGQPTAQLGRGDGSSLPQSAAQPVWAQIFGNWRSQSATGDTAKTSESDGGLFLGGDQAVGGGWRLGGALGYTDSHTTMRGLSSTSDIDSYSATIYGGKAFAAGPGKINLSLGAAYTWHDVKTKRQADAAGVAQTLKSSYGASTGQFFGELGYALPLNDRVTLEPFVGAGYNDLRTRGFSESGGDAALNGKSERNQLASTTLGLHAQTLFESAGAPGRLHATLGWRHAYGDVNPETTMDFQGSQTFTVTGAPIARDTAVMELGVDMAVTKRTTVGVAYGGQFGSGSRQNAGSLDVRYRF